MPMVKTPIDQVALVKRGRHTARNKNAVPPTLHQGFRSSRALTVGYQQDIRSDLGHGPGDPLVPICDTRVLKCFGSCGNLANLDYFGDLGPKGMQLGDP